MRTENTIRDLTDALGEVRNRIRQLKSEEAALRRMILDACPNGEITGSKYALVVKHQSRRRFDPRFLPDHIRENARNWIVSQSQSVITRSLRVTSVGQPEFEVIERF